MLVGGALSESVFPKKKWNKTDDDDDDDDDEGAIGRERERK